MVGNFFEIQFLQQKWENNWTVIQIDEEKHQTVAAMLLDQEDSLCMMGSGESIVMGSGESVKPLMFFDISKLEAELVQIIKQEEVSTWKAYINSYDILNLLSFPMPMVNQNLLRGHLVMWLEPSCLEIVCLITLTVISSLSYSFRVSYP